MLHSEYTHITAYEQKTHTDKQFYLSLHKYWRYMTFNHVAFCCKCVDAVRTRFLHISLYFHSFYVSHWVSNSGSGNIETCVTFNCKIKRRRIENLIWMFFFSFSIYIIFWCEIIDKRLFNSIEKQRFLITQLTLTIFSFLKRRNYRILARRREALFCSVWKMEKYCFPFVTKSINLWNWK